MVLMQNKVDLLNESQVSNAEAEDLATRLGVKLFRTSVRDDTNVSEIFEDIAVQFVDQRQRQQHSAPVTAIGQNRGGGRGGQTGGFALQGDEGKKKKKKKRCLIL